MALNITHAWICYCTWNLAGLFGEGAIDALLAKHQDDIEWVERDSLFQAGAGVKGEVLKGRLSRADRPLRCVSLPIS